MSRDDIIQEAHKRFALAEEAEANFRKNAKEDLLFCAEDQWDAQARQMRESSGRPCMQVDRINPSIRQIVNESRQNRPSIEVKPVSSGADEDVAAVFGGLIRHIENESGADIAYDTAEEYAVKTGLGYFRLLPEYCDSQAFEQSLVIKPVTNPESVYVDPFHKEVDGSDYEWAFIVVDMPTGDFEREYADSKLVKESKVGGWQAITNCPPGWVTGNSVRVAEYFYRDYTKKKLYQLSNTLTGQQTVEFSTPDIEKGIADGTLIKVNERWTEVCVVKWLKLAGNEVLEETTFPSKFIPIFPVKGEEFWVDGKRFLCGAVRRAKDAQRALNYLRSAQIEAVDLAPKAPFIGVAGQFDSFEADWRDANRKNLAYLEYNPVDVAGNPAGAPQRSSVEPAIQAIMATGGTAVDDMKAIFGIFDASLGNNGNETSGVAIVARKEQSSNSNFHFYDNLVRAIRHLGRVMVEVIPTLYDTKRTIRIVKPNGEQQLKVINDLTSDKPLALDAGKYDVVVKTGPTYATKRQKLVEQGTSIISAYPAAGPLIADLLVAASDFEGAEQLAARLRTQVPPDALEATGENDSEDPKARAAALGIAVKQLKQNLEALNAHAHEVEQQLKAAQEELKLQKMSEQADTTEAQLKYAIEAQKLKLQEATTELEFLVKQQEFELQKMEMELKQRDFELKAAGTTAKVNLDTHKAEMEYLDRSRDLTIGTISDVKPLPPVGKNPDPGLGGKFGAQGEGDFE